MTDSQERVLRSVLFAPANHERHALKALASAADGAILDIEDAVAIPEKPAARAHVHTLLRGLAGERASTRPLVIVRVNGLTTPFAYEDLCAVVGPGLDAVMVPKLETASQAALVDWLITQLERQQGLPEGRIQVLPIIETALGLCNAREIAAATPRIQRLNFGAGDFSLDTNMTWVRDNPGLAWARAQLVIVSRAARLQAPLDTVFGDLGDQEGLEREAQQALALGYTGKACIHPAQVAIVNRVFTPAAAEVERAERIVSAFQAALAEGSASLRVGDQFVDYPVAERAERVLRRASAIRERETGENV